jgi:uncharacterized membrane protein
MANRKLYYFLLFALFGLVFLSLGGGIWGAEQSINHWTGVLFQSVCHQDPTRSLSVFGTPMAVNSRCFGIFTGILIGWIAIPLLTAINFKNKLGLVVLLFAVMLQILDYSGNMLGYWENTNISRVLLGSFLGVAVSLSLSDFFHNDNQT